MYRNFDPRSTLKRHITMIYLSIIQSISKLIHYLTKDNSVSEKPLTKQINPINKRTRKKAIDTVFEKDSKEEVNSAFRNLLLQYNASNEEELFYMLLEKRENRLAITEEEEAFIALPQFESHLSWYELAVTIVGESARGQEMAINDLVNNRYEIFPNEAGNPMKEMLNPILKMFQDAYRKDTVTTIRSINLYFPKSSKYIIAFLQQHPSPKREKRIKDPIVLYNEFTQFNINYFLRTFPDKRKRDIAVRDNFRHLASSLISMLDEQELLTYNRLS